MRKLLRRLFGLGAPKAAKAKSTTTDWSALALARLPYLAELAEPERLRALGHLNAIANGVPFVGADGLEITEEMVVVIAGTAARLSRNLPLNTWQHLRRITVTPAHLSMHGSDDIVFGLASSTGEVTLSWNAVTHGLNNPLDGHDTAVHEFAHILDVGDGLFDGIPPGHAPDHHGWAHGLARGFVRFQMKADKGLKRRNVMRAYGATNAAEFFAVATEAFFEKPLQLKKKKPEVYQALARYYRIDPLRKRR